MHKVAIIGAGIGGLVAALLCAAKGCEVSVFEAAATPGGKLREMEAGGTRIDAGPTVFTLKPIFEAIFADAGFSLADHLTLEPLDRLAHHAWEDGSALDLFADTAKNIDAIRDFAGAEAARAYADFAARSARIFEMLDASFMQSADPGLGGLLRRAGPKLAAVAPFATLWVELGRIFKDARLRQLFARYATYCGSSPFSAPATLMLIAHAEQRGVWRVEGGMHRLAQVIATLAQSRGAVFQYNAPISEILTHNGKASGIKLANGEEIVTDSIIANVDIAALTNGLLGSSAQTATRDVLRRAKPSLSAMTWGFNATASGHSLAHHNVFFSSDYAAEFEALNAGRLPLDPTIYLCAQGPGRYFMLVNAPAGATPSDQEVLSCQQTAMRKLSRCGLDLRIEAESFTGPAEFARLFPATKGALYGRALAGWQDSFSRPAAKTKLPGLYLAGGGVHPGPGLPMAALSGRHAASSVLTAMSRRAVMPGGISTR